MRLNLGGQSPVPLRSNQQGSDDPRLNQIPSPKALGLKAKSDQPFQIQLAHPARSCGYVTGDVVEIAACIENDVGRDIVYVFSYPLLLSRHPHADHQDVRLEQRDLAQHLHALLTVSHRIEVAMSARDQQPRMLTAQLLDSSVDHTWFAAEVKHAPAILHGFLHTGGMKSR